MGEDIGALRTALARRGFGDAELLVADGVTTRARLLDVLAQAANRVASWHGGIVMLAVSGHGSFRGTTAADARPALQLADGEDRDVPWQDVFAALRVPPGVRLLLLPDT
jgi:hypothetical protein